MTLRIILFILIITPKIVFCQDFIIQGKVLNEKNQPLEYVSIGIINKSTGTISDKNGIFSLHIQDELLEKYDSLRFSMIGYHSKTYSLNELKKSIKSKRTIDFILSEKIENIEEVVISTKKIESKEIGTTKTSLLSGAVNFAISEIPNQNLGSEIGRKFNINHENTLLDKFQFYILRNEFDTIKFRINVYSIRKLKPYSNLLKKNIFVEITGKQTGWIKIDLLPYEIYVNEDIVVSIEWVSKSRNGTNLSIPITSPTASTHFYKFGSQNRWKRFNSMSSIMNLEIKY